jgi:hypothetical protein
LYLTLFAKPTKTRTDKQQTQVPWRIVFRGTENLRVVPHWYNKKAANPNVRNVSPTLTSLTAPRKPTRVGQEWEGIRPSRVRNMQKKKSYESPKGAQHNPQAQARKSATPDTRTQALHIWSSEVSRPVL